MADTLGAALRAVRELAGVSLAGLARVVRYSESHLRNIENGNRACTVDIAQACDAALGTGGLLADLVTAERDHDEMKRRAVLCALGFMAAGASDSTGPSRVTDALGVVLSDGTDSSGSIATSLAELVVHYSHSIATAPPAMIYPELLELRAHAGSVLERSSGARRHRADLLVGIGWLSNLLAIATSYLGDHAAAVVWCTDAERRSHQVGHPELAGWAALTRAMIAYYQGRPGESAVLAARGCHETSLGTIVHAKLAAQEMRARAMHGDVKRMADAKRHATKAMDAIPADATNAGAFSIAIAEDPPYTATSLLLADRFSEAASATTRVIQTAYGGGHGPGARSSNYARTLLILGLARVGAGQADEAVAAGHAALDSADVVWPTLVLARELDGILTHDHPDAVATRSFHARFLDASRQLPAPNPRAKELNAK